MLILSQIQGVQIISGRQKMKQTLKYQVGDKVSWLCMNGIVKEVNERYGSYLVKWSSGCLEWMGNELKPFNPAFEVTK